MTFTRWAIALSVILSCSCTRGAFRPVNVGREYGDPVPIMVSHVGKGSPHYILQNVLCFDYMCRLGAGKKKGMRQLSFEDFKKRIEKNARQGKYQNLTPLRPVKADTVIIPKDTAVIVPVVAAPVLPPVLQADSLIVLSDLLFELNSARLRDEHVAALDSLAAFLNAHPSIRVFVTGHTDSTGSERHNVVLSTRRAEGVSDYLLAKGVPLERLTFEGFGSSRPIAGNGTEAGRQRNRRVEVLLKKPED